ncbi:MAG: hypothetical protein JWP63_3154 [Candidatus Solibacter sp.]|nr:hypothetical protein [Candidatus Solibacter sp.]
MVALGAAPAHAISLITNGSFDAPGTVVGGFSGTCTTGPPNCPALPGWNVQILSGNGQIDCIVPGSAGASPTLVCTPGDPPSTSVGGGKFKFTLWATPGPSPNGGNFFLVDGGSQFSGALSQTVTGLTVGSIYRLSFWQAATQENCLFDDGVNCDPPGNVNLTQKWQVTFGSTVLTSTTMSTPIHTSFAWNQQIMYFTAQSTSQVLKFFAQGTPDSAPPIALLDDVVLVEAPEAATSGLLALGLLAVAAQRWKRRSRQ